MSFVRASHNNRAIDDWREMAMAMDAKEERQPTALCLPPLNGESFNTGGSGNGISIDFLIDLR